MAGTLTFKVTVVTPPGGSDDAGNYAVDLAEATSALGYDVGPFELMLKPDTGEYWLDELAKSLTRLHNASVRSESGSVEYKTGYRRALDDVAYQLGLTIEKKYAR